MMFWVEQLTKSIGALYTFTLRLPYLTAIDSKPPSPTVR